MDMENSPFQVNLGYQIPRNKAADYIGRAEPLRGGHPNSIRI
jgi:aminomethyltransferase